MNTYEKNLSEPWFTLIKLKIKSVEGRLNKDTFKNNELSFERKFTIQITDIVYYDNFKNYLEQEKLENCLPGIDTIEDGLNVYYKYYKKTDELKYKIKAFKF